MLANEIHVDPFSLSDPTIKSPLSRERIRVRFVNSAPEAVDLCWVDCRGKIVRYDKLFRGQSAVIYTYVGNFLRFSFLKIF
ncbi:unnamed protein product [Gongylonema pulchrum]|uniref:VHL domain-containing protein n=1 Tax=Gongylonema pulchrum TaxID=637853 RepID=A0A183DGG0_9BILA|nr:unnamed protein product [Gongylonema pulchrum]